MLNKNVLLALIIGGLTGLALGNIAFDNLTELKKAKNECALAKHEIERLYKLNLNNQQKILLNKTHITNIINDDIFAAYWTNINEITENDLLINRYMQVKQDQGDYFLSGEFPVKRKVQDRENRRLAESIADKNGPAIEELFRNFGMPKETNEQMRSHLRKIHEAALGASCAIMDLMEARDTYDQRLKSLLSAENYARYRQYEAGHLAELEWEKIKQFAAQHEKNLTAEDQAALLARIQSHQAYTIEYYLGPYDEIPAPTRGKERVLTHLEQQYAQLRQNSEAALKENSAPDLPERVRQVLGEYYRAELDNIKYQIDSIKTSRHHKQIQ